MDLHPQYFFFFPLDPRERASNHTCSIDADGFRGPGPAHARGPRLAFLLGGSSAFGQDASSDATTITGYLNRLQDEYFFVNAGVPGWDSTQEMVRVAFQILDYHPVLVVTYDGFNDAVLLTEYSQSAAHYPVGTPAGFDTLAALVDRRGSTLGKRATALEEYLFPALKENIDAISFGGGAPHSKGAASVGPPSLPDSALRDGASRYLSNLLLVRDVTAARGARFVAVFQPVLHLHRHLKAGLPGPTFAVDGFHRTVMSQYSRIPESDKFEFHDLGSVFDQYYTEVPVLTRDITEETVFTDEAHLYDPGNEIVARELMRLLDGGGGSKD